MCWQPGTEHSTALMAFPITPSEPPRREAAAGIDPALVLGVRLVVVAGFRQRIGGPFIHGHTGVRLAGMPEHEAGQRLVVLGMKVLAARHGTFDRSHGLPPWITAPGPADPVAT
jgi:hypothetical protein